MLIDEWIQDVEIRIRAKGPQRARHFERIMGFVPGNMNAADFYKEVGHVRSLAQLRFSVGAAVIAGVSAFVFFSEQVLWLKGSAIGLGLAGVMYFVGARFAMRQVHREFYRYRILPYQYRLKAEYPELQVLVPALRAFRKAPDLLELERRFLEGVRREVARIERAREMRRWDARNEKLREKLLLRICEARLPEEAKAQAEEGFLECWEVLPRNPNRRKKYLDRVDHFIAQREFELLRPAASPHPVPSSSVPEAPREAASEPDRRLAFLEAEAGECVSPAARELARQAIGQSDRRTRIRLLKQAIRAERAEEEDPIAASAEEEVQIERSKGENRFIVLDQLLETSFHINEFVPSGMDAGMAKEILLELLDPGNGQRRFQNAYRPEARLRRRVRQRYESWQGRQFDPRSYQGALDWLVREGVLRTKPKRDRAYSLSANALEAKSAAARGIIAAVLRLDREVRSL